MLKCPSSCGSKSDISKVPAVDALGASLEEAVVVAAMAGATEADTAMLANKAAITGTIWFE
jgi:hypothetical protein